MSTMHKRKISLSSGDQRNRVFSIVVLICGLAIVWIAYELGQIRAGHNGLTARQRYTELEARLDESREQNNELRQKIALLETSGKIDEEAYRQVEQRLVDLQNEILEQREDLAFYRGIVADQKTGLRVQDFELMAGDEVSSFSLRLVLAQAMRASQRISGSVELQIEGIQNGKSLTLGLDELGVVADQRKSLVGFSFRYFQNLEADLVLPEGFAPERVIVTLRPKGPRAKPQEKIFDWDVRPG
jgi:cell division protein FtsB